MTETKILEEVIPANLSAYAKARYVKIYQSPTRDSIHVFDMMHYKGFRINFDIKYGVGKSEFLNDTMNYIRMYRPDSWKEIEDDICFIAKFTADVLSINDILTPYEIGSGKFQTRWCQMMFADFLKKIRINISYERAVSTLDEYYAAIGI